MAGFLLVLAKVALITFVSNLVLLAVGHHLWTSRVRKLQKSFRAQLDSLSQLNFSASENLTKEVEVQHELTSLLARWSRRERDRFAALTAEVHSIPDPLDLTYEQSRALQKRLERAVDAFLVSSNNMPLRQNG